MIKCPICKEEIQDDAIKCKHCGEILNKNAYTKISAFPTQAQAPPVKSNFYPTFFLALFLGSFGVHRFYTGKIKSGILQLVTFGGCGLWWFLDMVLLLSGNFKDKNRLAMPNVNPKATWPVFLVVLAFGGCTFLGALGLAGSNGLLGKTIADNAAKAHADNLAKIQADRVAKEKAEANQSTATSLSNTPVKSDEADIVKVHANVHEYDSSGWAGMEVAKLIWKTARKNPKAKTIEVTVELKASLTDQYGKEVPEPHIMGTITESDLDEVRKYVSADDYAKPLGGGGTYGFSIKNMTYGWLLRKD